MDSRKLKLLFHTLKYLRFKQVYYRGYYLIRNKFFKRAYEKSLRTTVDGVLWDDGFFYTNSYKNKGVFKFLNITHDFGNQIDWNYPAYGKLWTYNLNYFDFLNQSDITVEEGLFLIHNYLDNDSILKDGKEPYPISLRGINWIKFLGKHQVSDPRINQTLCNHYQLLFHNLEYHLLGNHLLENGYALLFGACYFKDETLYNKAKAILEEELTEQVLNDGAHFELSPMYHQILLSRLLDCVQLLKNNPWKEDSLVSFLEKIALKMTAWLDAVTFSDGTIPMVNDSAYGIAPSTKELLQYAKALGLEWQAVKLSDSGYRKFKQETYELFVDVGNVGPTYQPGHAHADTFNFELYVQGKPVIVDTGVSTYEKNALRQQERSTAAHNTVKVGVEEQTQVWGGFRVAKRATVSDLNDTAKGVKATHNGYSHLGLMHTRSFTAEPSKVCIQDDITGSSEQEQVAYFHFHPSALPIEIDENSVNLVNQGIRITFDNVTKIEKQNYEYAMGFNQLKRSEKIAVSFCNTLHTQIIL